MRIATTSDRLKQLMDYYDIKQKDISEKTGIKKSALSNYVAGTREPKTDAIMIISNAYDISPSWLSGFSEEMKPKTHEVLQDDNAIILASITTNPLMMEYVAKLMKLPEEKRQHIFDLIDMLS